MTIPKIVHYVWVGPNKFPEDASVLLQGWREILCGYEIKLWDERNIDFTPAFIRHAHAARAYNRVANYARLAALRDYGGFYLDHDIELVKSLDELRDQQCLFGFQTMNLHGDSINNAVIGAELGNPFIVHALKTLDSMDGGFDWGSQTGPGLITKLMREMGDITPQENPIHVGGVTLYPPPYFYPYEWTEAFDPSCITSQTVAIHHWDHAWKHKRSFRAALVKFMLRKLARINASLASELVKRIDTFKKRGFSR